MSEVVLRVEFRKALERIEELEKSAELLTEEIVKLKRRNGNS